MVANSLSIRLLFKHAGKVEERLFLRKLALLQSRKQASKTQERKQIAQLLQGNQARKQAIQNNVCTIAAKNQASKKQKASE